MTMDWQFDEIEELREEYDVEGNPGGVRVPLPDAKRGGISDCRNRNLQKMFQLLGAGEQAGSGMPKIYKNWKSQSWRQPEFVENITGDREETLLRLRMVSLLPPEALRELGGIFGDRFYALPETHRIALVAALVEGSLSHSRLAEMTQEHPHDLSKTLHDLVEQHFLESDGTGRGTYYFLPGCHPVAKDAFSSENGGSSIENELSHRDPELSHKLSHKDSELSHKRSDNDDLKEIAAPVSSSERSSRETVRLAIVALCRKEELSVQEIAELLNRKEQTVRKYIEQLCDEGLLKPKFPLKTHPKQRYRGES